MDEAAEKCGVAAVYCKDKTSIVYSIYKLLLNMQNRGQLSAGMTTYDKDRPKILNTHKGIGLVNDVFKTFNKEKSQRLINNFAGSSGIGHVRYATSGSDELCLAQPFERMHGRMWKWFSFCFNGNLANYKELKEELLKKESYHMINDSDTEVMMHYIARQLRFGKKPELVDVFSNLAPRFDGAYNIAFIDAAGRLAVARDPMGFRPLSYGTCDGNVFVASETNALMSCGVEKPVAVQPGQMLIVENGNVELKTFAKAHRTARCMFEWVYFANLASVIDGISIYSVRKRLGTNLAKQEKIVPDKDTIIVPVPETSKAVCDAMAFELGIPVAQGLVKNRYLGRTFIEGKNREDLVRNKFTVLREVVDGKKVILVDDSLVRGTTMKILISYLRRLGGAKEVHIRLSCPPIVAPCFYGIDMSTISELMAPQYYPENIDDVLPDEVTGRIAKDLGADSISYQSHKGLVDSIGLSENEICMACLNGKYPTECGKSLYCEALENFKCGKCGRTYE